MFSAKVLLREDWLARMCHRGVRTGRLEEDVWLSAYPMEMLVQKRGLSSSMHHRAPYSLSEVMLRFLWGFLKFYGR